MHIRPRTIFYQNGRANLRLGLDEPTALNTGVLPGVARSNYAGDLNLTAGQVVKDLNITGKVTSSVANASLTNCLVTGTSTQTGIGLVTSLSINNSNFKMTDCTIYPQNPDYRWMGVNGANFTMLRCDVGFCQDTVEIKRDSSAYPWLTNVIIQQSYLHDMAWWTAGTAGVVHPSDVETHNDIIQHFGGGGTQILGNALHGQYARNYGHWFCTGSITAEPYTAVALHSLGDSLNGPNKGLPDRGSGTEATGRYNWDDIACIQIGDEQDTSENLIVHDNWFYGGGNAISGAGNANRAGTSLGSWKRNKFDRSQGNQSSGGDTTWTMGLGPWTGQATIGAGADANVYMDNGHPVTVRFA